MVEKNEQGQVLYSSDFNFFMEHQVAIWYTNNRKSVTVTSRLEARKFFAEDGNKEFADDFIKGICYGIHSSLPYYKEEPKTMTKQEAIAEMQKGKKVRHQYFSPDEWMTMEDGQIVLEDGVKCSTYEFWRWRTDAFWDNDYSLVEEK
jgi:hypothetical protein